MQGRDDAVPSRVYNMRMTRVNVYLPDDLADDVRRADLNVSAITQKALREQLAARSTDSWLRSLEDLEAAEVDHDTVVRALDEGRDDFGR